MIPRSVDPVHKEDFLTRVLPECYPHEQPSVAHVSSDRLSAIFMVFAVGAFFDFEQPLVSREAEDYYVLARAALCVRPIYDYPTVYAIQSMVYINNPYGYMGYIMSLITIFPDINDVVSDPSGTPYTCIPTTFMGCFTDCL